MNDDLEKINSNDDVTEDGKAAEKSDKEKRKPFADAYEWISSLVFAVLLMLALNLFGFRSITVDGDSMVHTLLDRDQIIASSCFYNIDYGDIVIIQADKIYNKQRGMFGEPIIKRVIGLSGDVIRFDFEAGEVYRNGEKLSEPYIAESTTLKQQCESGIDYTVPENCVFVMGDNRNVSRDSRDMAAVGYVDKNLIMGKALFRFYPLGDFKVL